MRPYYHTHVQALVDNGICKLNKVGKDKVRAEQMIDHYLSLVTLNCSYLDEAYDPNDRDEHGVPNKPIAHWIKGQEWRAASFDETRLDDTTHGAAA